MKNLLYLALMLFVSCATTTDLDNLKDVSVNAPKERAWNLTLTDKDITYTLIASTLENQDMQFSVETTLNKEKQTVNISYFPNIKRYALADLNTNNYDQLIFIGTSSIRPENELLFIFNLDTSNKPYKLTSISLPELEGEDRKKLNSVNTYSVKPPYIERKVAYQPLAGDLQKETIIYKINDSNEAEVVSKTIY